LSILSEKTKGLFKYYLNRDFDVSIADDRLIVEMPYELGFNQQVQYYKKLLAEKINSICWRRRSRLLGSS